MNPTRIPGNEPDSGDMSVELGPDGKPLNSEPLDPGIAEEQEADKLGDFA